MTDPAHDGAGSEGGSRRGTRRRSRRTPARPERILSRRLAGWMRCAGLAALAMFLDLSASGSAGAAADSPPSPTEPRVSAQTTAPGALPAATEAVYANARPRLLQVRTVLGGAERQSTIGSGFLVGTDGLVVTNYHVVAQFASEPRTYRLEYSAPDRSTGSLQLLAIDVINDLAVVRLDKPVQSPFEFDERALHGTMPKGERLYAMGNPLDLGFTIVEGTYNGLVDKSYNERIHFSGAVNPGMSGGPAVTRDGRVAGINVAKMLSGELVSFLVPARFAAALIERARSAPLGGRSRLEPASVSAEIRRQITAWQSEMYRSLLSIGFRASPHGRYLAPESGAGWFSCWGQTNSGRQPKPRAIYDSTICNTNGELFLAENFGTGTVEFSHSYVHSIDLNAFQFAAFLSENVSPPFLRGMGRKHVTPQRCHEDFVAAAGARRPTLRVVWCARAYREYEGLYDVALLTVTQDRPRETLVSRLTMHGIAYPNALAMGRKFIESVEVAK